MNRTDFHGYIRNPGSVDSGGITGMREVLQLFPWFQSANMLLLRGLKSSDDVRFDNQLKDSAAHIADREKLYYLINSEMVAASATAELVSLQSSAVPESASLQQFDISEPDSPGQIDVPEKFSLQPSDEETLEAPDKGIVLTATRPVEDLKAEIEQRLSEIGDGLLEIEGAEGEVIAAGSPYSGNSNDDSGVLLEFDTGEEEVLPGERHTDHRSLQNDLIEKFIRLSPRIEVSREKSDAPSFDLSEQHTAPKISFVSETLARIYIDQGYYSRAVDIYERLCLKYPEKSSYFASQIEKIEDLIKKA